MSASDICLNKEVLFYHNSPEDYNNASLMFEAAVVRDFSLCNLHVGGVVIFFLQGMLERGDQISHESMGTTATGHVLVGC